jgi:hypothetical protein
MASIVGGGSSNIFLWSHGTCWSWRSCVFLSTECKWRKSTAFWPFSKFTSAYVFQSFYRYIYPLILSPPQLLQASGHRLEPLLIEPHFQVNRGAYLTDEATARKLIDMQRHCTIIFISISSCLLPKPLLHVMEGFCLKNPFKRLSRSFSFTK